MAATASGDSVCIMQACEHGTCLQGTDFQLQCLCSPGFLGALCNEQTGANGETIVVEVVCNKWECNHGKCNVQTSETTTVGGVVYPFVWQCDAGWSGPDCSQGVR